MSYQRVLQDRSDGGTERVTRKLGKHYLCPASEKRLVSIAAPQCCVLYQSLAVLSPGSVTLILVGPLLRTPP